MLNLPSQTKGVDLMTDKELIKQIGPARLVAEILGVNIRTVQRWSAADKMPKASRLALESFRSKLKKR